jgi:hypothetical protein
VRESVFSRGEGCNHGGVRATLTLLAGVVTLAFSPVALADPAPIPPPEALRHAQQVAQQQAAAAQAAAQRAAAQQRATKQTAPPVTSTTPATTTPATVTPATVTPVRTAPSHSTAPPPPVRLDGGRQSPASVVSATPATTPGALSTRSAALPAAPVPRAAGPVATHGRTISGPTLAALILLFVLVEAAVIVFAWRRASNPVGWLRSRPHAMAHRIRRLRGALPVLPAWLPGQHPREHDSAVGLVPLPPPPEPDPAVATAKGKPRATRSRKRQSTRSKSTRTRAEVTAASAEGADDGQTAKQPAPRKRRSRAKTPASPTGPARA